MADMHAGKYDLTRGNVTKTMLSFAWPFILGNLFQQLYNITDTMIVGRFLGTGSLAAVGAAYTLMTFITSVIIGLCLGCGTIFSHLSGAGDYSKLRRCIYISFASIGLFSILLNAASSAFITPILHFINIPDDILGITEDYTLIVTFGIVFIFIYNFYTSLLRSIGNSAVPLIFLIISVALNIGLDLLFIVSFNWGIKGAALATVISQFLSAVWVFAFLTGRQTLVRLRIAHMKIAVQRLKKIVGLGLSGFMMQATNSVVQIACNNTLQAGGAAYQAALEERLEELIRQVEGAGETAVLVTLESGEERVYALDTQTGRDQTQQTHVLLDDGTALEQTVCPPTVCGVAVVCDGGGQVSVQARITSLLSALLDVPANRICVEQRRGQPGI